LKSTFNVNINWSVGILLSSDAWAHQRGLVGFYGCMPPVSELWLQLVRLLTLTLGARGGWAVLVRFRGRRRVHEARRALMRSGALVDGGPPVALTPRG